MHEHQLSERLQLPVIAPRRFHDDRGYLFESWNCKVYRDLGLPGEWVQDNVSSSTRGVLRGMHFQQPHAQGKLVQVLAGAVYDVAVDIRVGSPTFGVAEGFELTAENATQVFIPERFAHGFLVTSERALFTYKVSGGGYVPDAAKVLHAFDPALSIDWPKVGADGQPLEHLMKPADAEGATLSDLEAAGLLPRYTK